MTATTENNNNNNILTIQQAIRQSVSPAKLQQWLKINPYRAYWELTINWQGIIVAFLAVFWIPRFWMYAIAFLVIGTCQYKLFILAHDAIHNALHPNKKVNDFLARWLVYGPMFMALEDARRNHLKHHQFMGTAEDPDRYLHTFYQKNAPFQFLLFCSGLATFGKTVLKVTPFGKLLKLEKPLPPNPPLLRDEGGNVLNSSLGSSQRGRGQNLTSVQHALTDYFQQRFPVFIAQLLILSLIWISPLPLWSYLVLWIAPIYFLVFVPDEIRAFCDHAVLEFPDDRGDARRLVTFRPNFIEAIFFSPHHMNYHAEHHLWSAIPHYNLPKAHEFVKGRGEVTIRGSYLAFLGKVLRSLPL
ncbi:MAG TPA: fatty acid desaturase family protein [Oscillatoriales cyanobacterium M59_W2019_021]|nr:fatty acid desaturase family protein [Oscillatoriales cyanobacterium M4454_W2019_049]HIK52347.1 fatty acid desaturase family protein [Oscillatoriales cyanobacterium M59_W2019_021]